MLFLIHYMTTINTKCKLFGTLPTNAGDLVRFRNPRSLFLAIPCLKRQDWLERWCSIVVYSNAILKGRLSQVKQMVHFYKPAFLKRVRQRSLVCTDLFLSNALVFLANHFVFTFFSSLLLYSS